METTARDIRVDIEDIMKTSRGSRVLNAFMSSSATLWQTRRGRKAITVRADIFEKLMGQLKFETEEGLDGLQSLKWSIVAAAPTVA